MPKVKTLLVFANPYLHLDHEGRLAGRCQAEPMPIPGALRFVGAAFHSATDASVKKFPEGDPRGSHTQDTVFSFSAEASSVDPSPYYLQKLRSGELLAAGEDGGPPWHELARARNAAIENAKAHHGEPDTAGWAAQFPIDSQVEAIAEKLAERDATKATAAKKRSEGAAASAKDDQEKAAQERKDALEKSHKAALEALGPDQTSAAQPAKASAISPLEEATAPEGASK